MTLSWLYEEWMSQPPLGGVPCQALRGRGFSRNTRCLAVPSSFSKTSLLFISSPFTVMIEACQPQEFCSPARNHPALPSCPQQASEAPLASGAQAIAAEAALQKPGSFYKEAAWVASEWLSVTSGGILITYLLFNVLKHLVSCFIYSLKAQPVCWHSEQTMKYRKLWVAAN